MEARGRRGGARRGEDEGENQEKQNRKQKRKTFQLEEPKKNSKINVKQPMEKR